MCDEKGNVDLDKNVVLRNYKKVKIKGSNIFSVEDENTIYYILICESKPFENFIAFTRDSVENSKNINCTRIIVEYEDWREQHIYTHEVKRVKRIGTNLYKVRTNHTYYILKI